jgi:hypothetical protein
MARRSGERRAIAGRRGGGAVWHPWPPLPPYIVGYHVYSNTGIGNPINYSNPIATILGFGNTGYQLCNLSYPGIWSFGVRAFNQFGEEANVDTVVTIVLDVNGNDITARPLAPTGLALFPLSHGNLRAIWSYPPVRGPKSPTGFHVYIGTGGIVNYATPVATVPYSSAIVGSFLANLTALTGPRNRLLLQDGSAFLLQNNSYFLLQSSSTSTDSAVYTVGVRAYNAAGEEPNTATASATTDSTGPQAVDSLTVTATAIA